MLAPAASKEPLGRARTQSNRAASATTATRATGERADPWTGARDGVSIPVGRGSGCMTPKLAWAPDPAEPGPHTRRRMVAGIASRGVDRRGWARRSG